MDREIIIVNTIWRYKEMVRLIKMYVLPNRVSRIVLLIYADI